MLRNKLYSLFNFKAKDSKFEKALASHAQTIRNAPRALQKLLALDIAFLSSLQMGYDGATGVEDIDPEQTAWSSGTIWSPAPGEPLKLVDSELPTKHVAGSPREPPNVDLPDYSAYYNERRLSKLLIAVGNYHHWLKQLVRAKRATPKQIDLVEFLSHFGEREDTFPKRITKLVDNIRTDAGSPMMQAHHSLLLSYLVQLQEEL